MAMATLGVIVAACFMLDACVRILCVFVVWLC